jgi:hypothetical protein
MLKRTCIFLMINLWLIMPTWALPVEFFASNNTHTIDMQQAYVRLIGHDQHKLQNNMIKILQKYHVEQGAFTPILGAYQLSEHQKVTADNTDKFISSPLQPLTDKIVFAIATDLAISLQQESVAVFIPDNHAGIGDVCVKFKTQHPRISETIAMLNAKLPADYSQAYSLHLQNEYAGFNDAKVSGIKWLGNKINIDEIKNAFPEESVTSQNGRVYLVYQNGQTLQI